MVSFPVDKIRIDQPFVRDLLVDEFRVPIIMTDFALEDMASDYATAMADRANRYMVQHGVAPTPGNFAVWFSYAQGVLPELKRTIDILISGNKRFDTATSRQLYTAYLAANSPGSTLGEVPEQLSSIMTEAKR